MLVSNMGRVLDYLLKGIEEKGTLHFTLIDPDPCKVTVDKARRLAKLSYEAGTDAILIGGSINVTQDFLDEVIKAVKAEVKVPIILFPSGLTGISKFADAIFFMSLFNSEDPCYITGIQARASIIIKRLGLEAIPLAYLIVEPGEAAGYIGKARPIPENHPEIAGLYAAAAELFGFKFVYLERGSGAPRPLPPGFLKIVRKIANINIIVGGGIRREEDAMRLAYEGANVIVTGTIVEEEPRKLRAIIEAIREGARKRISETPI